MAGPEGRVQRLSTTRRFLDKRRNPWEHVEEELPTTTVKLIGPLRRTSVRAPRGTVAEGSYRVTGSNYDFGRGTYSLRITRLDLSVIGSPMLGTFYQWHVRHSREGTLGVYTLRPGVPVVQIPREDRIYRQGGPLNPLYSVGPGTLLWGWDTPFGGLGTRATLSASMEAIAG